ncbi:TMAO reductase system periplasmic protein TorT [Blastococcus sp. SYSU D00820]
MALHRTEPIRIRPPHRRGAVLGLSLTTALLVAACGGGSEGDDQARSTDTSTWTVPAVFVDCSAPDTDESTCQGEGTEGEYTSLSPSQVSGDWEICATVPHLQDPVWVGINYGVVTEAERLGVALQFHDAGGYENIAEQNSQIEDCVAQGVDAIIVGAVSADALNPSLQMARDAGIAVIDGGNGVASPDVDARAVLDYYDMGRTIGEYLAAKGEAVQVALFPGPAGVGWSERSVEGFSDAIEGSAVELVATKYGDPVAEVQTGLVEDTLSASPEVDVIVGTGVTVDVAATVLEERGLADRISTYSTYISPSVVDLLEGGGAACAPNDQGINLARVMVDLAVRTLEEIPYEGDVTRAAPAPVLICGPAAGADDNFDSFDQSTAFAPEDWSPVSEVGY